VINKVFYRSDRIVVFTPLIFLFMKHLLPAFFFIAFTASVSAQTYKIDTVVNESWTNNSWQLSSRIINTYNSACQLVTTTIQTRSGSSWVNQIRTNYTYTAGDQISQAITQQWNTATSAWDNAGRITYTYNATSKVLTTVLDIWSGGAWLKTSRVTNTYDASDYLITTLNEISLGGVLWNNQTLDTYTNNPDGTVNQQVSQNWNGLTWDNSVKYTYTYNADKSVQQAITQTWSGSAWVNSEKRTYTYDAQGRELTELIQTWNGSAWVNDTLTTNTFTGGQLTKTLEQIWDTGSSTWKNQSQTSFTYNGDGSLHQSVEQIANEAYTALDNNSRSTFHYTTDCVLPLTLLDFTAELAGKDVLLKWTTSEEINTSYFDIESSSDASTFQKKGTVKAANNSAKTSYEFTDANPAGLASGKIFYRLRMVDINGKFSHSKIAVVGLPPGANTFSVFPNVVKDNLFILYPRSTGKAGVRIIDESGRQVYNQQVNMSQPLNQYNVNVSSLKNGMYFVQLITNEGSKTAKFLKN
jgi:hypothetical protein